MLVSLPGWSMPWDSNKWRSWLFCYSLLEARLAFMLQNRWCRGRSGRQYLWRAFKKLLSIPKSIPFTKIWDPVHIRHHPISSVLKILMCTYPEWTDRIYSFTMFDSILSLVNELLQAVSASAWAATRHLLGMREERYKFTSGIFKLWQGKFCLKYLFLECC